MHTVREATEADVADLGAMLARAFHDDPGMAYMFPSAERRPDRLSRFFAYEVSARLGTVWTTGDRSGAAVWAAPGRWRTPPAEVAKGMVFFTRLFGRNLPAAARLFRLTERNHPDDPHWYLTALGVEPARQRLGVGSALLGPVLDRCDAGGVGAHLESTRANVPFYARHGFAVTRELRVPGGPTLLAMWRVPR